MKPVTIYTSSQCKYCHEAKEFLDKHNIRYTERNISTDVEARNEVIRMGYRMVPLIIVGDSVMSGYDRDELSKLLGL